MKEKDAQKIAYTVNSVMLSMIFGFMFFFYKVGANFLVYFSIPTAVVYMVTYLLIYKGFLNIYLWLCYGGLIIYTGATAICLGESYGFHLYCFSMIPCVYTVEYMSFKLGRKSVKSLIISVVIAIFYQVIMGYLNTNGPVYVTEKKYASFFMVLNSMTVFTYLVVYTNYLIRNIIRSETTLRDMANKDRLTGLYNRRYMLEKLEDLPDDGSAGVLAMADIDDFKKINDTYGHNAGDEVLKVVSQKMQNACKGCDISRWGGEEFLILCRTDNQSALDMLDNRESLKTPDFQIIITYLRAFSSIKTAKR